MEKHEHMVKLNREKSQAKVDRAIAAINKMYKDEEQVVVCTLVKRTGLSRAFFYNNKLVHNELTRVQELQKGKSFVAPQTVIINKAMDKEIKLLKKQIEAKDKKIAELNAEVEKLQKAVRANTLATIMNL